MRTFYQTLDEFITVRTSADGNVHRVITYKGEKYAEPYFTGQELGWIKEVLWEWKTRSFNCLIVSVSGSKLWLNVSLRDANKVLEGDLKKGVPIYFCIIQKQWHKPHTLPYWIYELSTYPGYLEGYKKPDFIVTE